MAEMAASAQQVASPPRHKAAADNMLQITKAPPNWPVYTMSLSIHLHDLHLGAQYSQTRHL